MQRLSRKHPAADPALLIRTTAGRDTIIADYKLCASRFTPPENLILSQIFHEQNSAMEEECCLSFGSVEQWTAFGVIDTLAYMQDKAWRYSWNSLRKTFSIVINVSRVHECHGRWMHMCLGQAIRQSFISWADYKDLHLTASLDRVPFAPPYAHSAKEPDQCVIPANSKFPTIVVEAGWSESRAQLHEDMKLWLTGGRADVQLVIVLKWTKVFGNRVQGDVEAFERGVVGKPRCVQHETVFPMPDNAAQQAVRITKCHLWGRHLPAGYDGDDRFGLSLDLLREVARPAIYSQDCIPA